METQSEERLRRSRHDRKFLGVCGGLGEYTGVDPLLWRVAFVMMALFHGVGIMLYLATAVVVSAPPRVALPTRERRALSTPELDLRAAALQAWPTLPISPSERRASRRRRIGAFIALLGAVILVVNLNLLAWVRWDVALPLALIFIGFALMLRQSR